MSHYAVTLLVQLLMRSEGARSHATGFGRRVVTNDGNYASDISDPVQFEVSSCVPDQWQFASFGPVNRPELYA